jgi:hypothetical protein
MTDMNGPAIGKQYPLLFTYRDTLFGNGFAVEVIAKNGRALCSHEEEGVWMYGVNPGGMAAFGADEKTAQSEFRRTFSEALNDLAVEARSFDEFSSLVREFFNDTNPGYERDWVAGVEAVREHRLQHDDLPKVSADTPRTIAVEMKPKESFTPADNRADLRPKLAA